MKWVLVWRWQRVRQWARTLATVASLVTLCGCVASTALKRAEFNAPAPPGTRVVMMVPDVQLSEVTAAGLEQPNAQWTALGTRNVQAALDGLFRSRSINKVPYREPELGSTEAHDHGQLLKLHEAVGSTILVHKFNQAAALPTKAERFDWTLGGEVRVLRDAYEADYALFVYLHDSYASGGRVALMVAMAAFGVAVPGGIQRGFASLVDLRTGAVVWFNVLVRGTGDLRSGDAAMDAVNTLLAEIPL